VKRSDQKPDRLQCPPPASIVEVGFLIQSHCALDVSIWHSINNDVDLLVACHVVDCQERRTMAKGHCWVADADTVC
jgi:hypothetical protein